MLTAARPQRVLIPAINLTADIASVGLRPDSSLAVPENFSLTGWYANGPAPGEPGPAVIVGHVDSHVGPAVFFRLHELTPGHLVIIEAVDGQTFTFIVQRVEQHSKNHFPTAAVYGPTNQPVLRLITCTGTFNRTSASYSDNLILFARLAA